MCVPDERPDFERTEEVPFNNDRKFMAVKCLGGDVGAALYYVKGGMEAVLSRCKRIFISRNEQSRLLTPELYRIVADTCAKVSDEGLRVIFMAVGEHLEDLALVGFVAMTDPIRRGVPGSVRRLVEGSVKVVMITGDSRMFRLLTSIEATAVSIAQRLGIHRSQDPDVAESRQRAVSASNGRVGDSEMVNSFSPVRDPGIMSGNELESLTERQLSELISRVVVFYRTTPKHKMTIIKAYQNLGNIVAMTGDGVNDAPALRMAASDYCVDDYRISEFPWERVVPTFPRKQLT